jgi:uncharacterized protein (UPF0335 family)
MDLSIHFRDDTAISDTTSDLYDPDGTKILASGSLTDIVNKIKTITDDRKEIISNIKEITQNIIDML